MPKALAQSTILGVPVTRTDYSHLVDWVIDCAKQKLSVQGTAAAVHNLVLAQQDPDHMKALSTFDFVTPDGQPVRWALNVLHGARLRQRVYGPELVLRICEAAEKNTLGVFFYGSNDRILNSLRINLSVNYPKLKIHTLSPGRLDLPFPDQPTDMMSQDLNKIRDSGAQILFVGLGCPKQEKWIWKYGSKIPMPSIGVGAAFDFHAGTLRQAPPWMQQRGLEWLYRLAKEPRRLWRRYLWGNTQFIAGIFLQLTNLKKY